MTKWEPDTDQLTTGLISVGLSGDILWLNEAAHTFISKNQVQIGKAKIQEALPEVARRIDTVVAHGQPIQISEVYLAKSGVAVDISLSLWNTKSILIELYPITERIRQRKHADRADRQQAIGQMARHLAHELRNPLAGVKAGAQLITNQTTDTTIARHADMIERGVDRITALLERFAESQTHRKAPLNLHQLLAESVELVLAERQGELALETDFDPSIPILIGDCDQLNQLFLNLLRNSAQANAATIRLITRIEHHSPIVNPPHKHAVRITIEDDGSGIPAHLHDRLFLPMVSGKDHGSGFGLAIAQQIARAHDGLIEYQPLENGSSFTFRLPLSVQSEEETSNAA